MGKKSALVLLAPGAEEMEVVITVGMLRRAGLDVTLAGLCDASAVVKCCKGINIKPDIYVSDAKGPYDIIVIPGGLGGSQSLSKSTDVGNLIKQQDREGRWIAAICSGPTALKAHRVGLGKKITCNPAMKEQLSEEYTYQEAKVVVDANIITSRGPGTAFDFAKMIIDKLVSTEKSMEVSKLVLLES